MNIFLKHKDIKIYTPVDFDTDIKGYWLDVKGHLYKDNIIIQTCNTYSLQRIKGLLFKAGELAVFYIKNDIAHIDDIKEGLTVLRKRKEIKRDFLNDFIISEYCRTYGGATVFKKDNHYIIEVWTK